MQKNSDTITACQNLVSVSCHRRKSRRASTARICIASPVEEEAAPITNI